MFVFLRKHIVELYLLSLALVVCGLSTSMFLMSLGTIMLTVVWVIEGGFRKKFSGIKFNYALIGLLAVYFIHVFGLLYSSNMQYGLNDLRIKLPLLVFPLVLATSIKLDKKKLDVLIAVFIGSVLVSTFYSFLIHKNIVDVEHDVHDPRSISKWISHIRLGLNICLAIFLLFFYYTSYIKKHYLWKIGVSLWFIYFLYIMESATGFLILSISVPVICGYQAVNATKVVYRALSVGILVLLMIISGIFIYTVIAEYYQPRDLDISNLPEKTKYGEKYYHDTVNLQLENGNYLWLYIAQNELETGWNSRSDFEYQGLDKKGQPLKYTLIRYMTSKGLRKDRDGLAQLNQEDIANVENGIATIQTLENVGIKRRLKIILYEFDTYFRGQTPNGSSVTQRFEYWRIGWNLFQTSKIFGVGTGDIDDDYKKQYREDESTLMMKFRHRAHNQYLTFLITFGIVGFGIFLFSLIWPLVQFRSDINLLYILFFMIIAFSFIGEDTLETQAGVTFYAAMNALLLFQILPVMRERPKE